MPIPGVDYDVVGAAVHSAREEQLANMGISLDEAEELGLALLNATAGGDRFDNNLRMVRMAYFILDASSAYEGHDVRTNTLKALGDLASKGFRSPTRGPHGLFGEVSVERVRAILTKNSEWLDTTRRPGESAEDYMIRLATVQTQLMERGYERAVRQRVNIEKKQGEIWAALGKAGRELGPVGDRLPLKWKSLVQQLHETFETYCKRLCKFVSEQGPSLRSGSESGQLRWAMQFIGQAGKILSTPGQGLIGAVYVPDEPTADELAAAVAAEADEASVGGEGESASPQGPATTAAPTVPAIPRVGR